MNIDLLIRKAFECISHRNRYLAWKHFYPEGKGKPKQGYVLHHINPDWKNKDYQRYIQWNIEDLLMMTKSDHVALHNTGKNNHNYGKHLSEETRKKISEANKGKPCSEETRKKISEAHKGKPCSEETKQKMSEAHKGKPCSEETRKKIMKLIKENRALKNIREN